VRKLAWEHVYRIKETCFVVVDASMFLTMLHSVTYLGRESKRLLFAPDFPFSFYSQFGSAFAQLL